MQASTVDQAAMEAPGTGLKRGLLEALLQLSMPQEVRHTCVVCWMERHTGVPRFT